MKKKLTITLVGPCASGKSTLYDALTQDGYIVRHPTQEHSHIPDMWLKRTHPDVLIYLDVSREALLMRRPNRYTLADRLPIQRGRLAHARAHCDLYIDTSTLTPAEVQHRARQFLCDKGGNLVIPNV